MTRSQFQRFCIDFYKSIHEYAPKDTRNLADNSIKVVWESDKVCKIYVDQKIAPYMPYTNEEWISPRWNGKKNPNEQWWNKIVIVTMNELATKYRGAIHMGKDFIVRNQVVTPEQLQDLKDAGAFNRPTRKRKGK